LTYEDDWLLVLNEQGEGRPERRLPFPFRSKTDSQESSAQPELECKIREGGQNDHT
jgi:hypothetical protein